jgi:trimeric autotransporter adhesin
MATIRWKGDAAPVAQVTGWTFGGTWEATDIVILTIGSKSVSVVAGSTTLTTVVDNVLAAWNALSSTLYPEFAELTASRSGNDLRLTADTAGKPFTVVITTTETGGGAADSQTIGSATTVTANSGPNDASIVTNWAGGALPADGDTIVFDQGNSDLLYGLDLNTITPAAIIIDAGFTGKIGLPPVNVDAGTTRTYYEYRDQYLRIGNAADAQAITITVRGGGSRLKINTGDAQTTLLVQSTNNPAEASVPTLLFKGTHASNALTVSKGSVGVAFYEGETATLVGVNVGYTTNPAGDSTVKLGAGVTLTNAVIAQSGGALDLNSATSGSATITQTDGVLNLLAGGHVGLTVRGGVCNYNSTGTLGGNPVVAGSGHITFAGDLRAKAVTNAIEVFGPQAKVSDPNKVVATLVLDLNETVNNANIVIGQNIRLTRGAVA